MSIQDKITRLQTAKTDIAEAITAAGGTVAEGDGFEEFSSDIGTISSGITVNESYDISEGALTKGNVTLEGDVVANIPDGVTTIGASAFSNNQIITMVIMPNSVTTIEDGAPWLSNGCFLHCINLKSIIFSNALTKIGNHTFSGCSSLTSITFPDSVTSIGDFAFINCTGLTSITIPDSITSISKGAFDSCSSLTSITIPDSVTSIGGGAFDSCSSLTSITIPDSVTSIGDYAFNNCTSLTDIYYTGTQAQWESITGLSDAGIPSGATIHYEYTPN